MTKEFRIIVVDNDTEEIIGRVTDSQSSGFSMIYRQQENDITQSFDSIDSLLIWSNENNNTIYYMIGGVRILFNHTTYDKNYYFRLTGWSNLTPAEAVILGDRSKPAVFHEDVRQRYLAFCNAYQHRGMC